MSRRYWRLALLFAALSSPMPAHLHAQDDSEAAGGDTARVIVKFADGAPLVRSNLGSGMAAAAARARSLGARLGLELRAGATVSSLAQVVSAAGLTSAELAERLGRQVGVAYAVPDERRWIVGAPNDPLYAAGVPGNGPAAGQWYLRAPTAEVQSSVNVEGAWAVTTGRPDVVVGVLDTGVRYDHPDLLPLALGGNLLPGYDMTSVPEMANDGDGRDADASDPGDWVTREELATRGSTFSRCATSPQDSSWHGTQVSGLIAALTNDGIGMAGVAPDVRVLPVRVLGKCGGNDSDIIAGLRWAVGLPVPGVPANPHPARVLNLSLGSEGSCSAAYQDAIDEVIAAGAVVVAAAGNSSGHAVGAPANCSGVVAVAGLRHSGTKAGYSSLGPEVAIGAPAGNCVNTAAGSACLYPMLTTTDSGATGPVSPTYTDSYTVSLGTSFSAPLVAGVAALVLAAEPALGPAQVRQILQGSARPFPPAAAGGTLADCTAPQHSLTGREVDQLECRCTTATCGAGMLDAAAAVAAAREGSLLDLGLR